MATNTHLNPQTAASALEPSLHLKSDDYDTVLAFATGLAGAEVVQIFITGGGAEIPFSVASAVVNLTATQPHVDLPCGPNYRFSKGATAAGVGIYTAVRAY